MKHLQCKIDQDYFIVTETNIQLIMLKKFYIKKEFFVQNKMVNIKEHYQIQELVGKGAFASVYRARMKYYPFNLRAIKRIKKKYIRNPADILNEYSVLTSLDYPQIIKIYQTFEDEDNFYMVIDFCSGGELFSKLEKQGKFTQNSARNIFSQMVNIIRYCHENHVCHRDLKPENFLISSNKGNDVMLIDFGLCYRWNENMKKQIPKANNEQRLIGTAYYISPEIFTGVYDERCDVWALGIILFMLVTGEAPIAGTTEKQILTNIKNGRINLNTLDKKNLNPHLVDIIKKILVPQASRISLKEILSHPWMIMQISQAHMNINFEKIRNYSRFSKFKVLTLNYIASQLSQKDIMVLGKVFLEIDENKDGYLTVEELTQYMNKQQGPAYEQIRELIMFMDVDHNGKLAYNEFISACLSKSAANSRQYLFYAFQNFDLNKDGKISRDELSLILKAYKKQYSGNQRLIDQLLKQCDKNNDNEIDFEEFCAYILADKGQIKMEIE